MPPTDSQNSDISLRGDSFFLFYGKMKNRPRIETLPYYIVGLDPGETTGVSIWLRTDSGFIVQPFQINTSIVEWGVDRFQELIRRGPGTLVVIEDYRIYSWRIKQHAWASLLTPRLIGVVETFCRLESVPLLKQSAQQGKAFVTDERLKEWGLHIPGRPHANDATRHVCRCLLFEEFK